VPSCSYPCRWHCQITPAIVREAYSLLRQSIIHVEQDDIQFEDDEDDMPPIDEMDEDAIDMADAAALDQAEASFQQTSSGANGSSSAPVAESSATPVPSAPKKKLRISYNRYMEIMNLWYVEGHRKDPRWQAGSVLHLSEIERESGTGVDRDELIEWYLEQKEHEMQSIEELDAERELIGKALTKLAKVRCDVHRQSGKLIST
jgi:DNA replication licensing factor MCM6